MRTLLLLGCGKIGRVIAQLLAESGDYRVRVTDVSGPALARLQGADMDSIQLDASDAAAIAVAAEGCETIISALNYRYNPLVAQVAVDIGASYFDLTEDVETVRAVRRLTPRCAPGQILMPQCGLAPGFISILAYHLIGSFDTLDTVQMRVGALPRYPANGLNYNLTWSTDGLINEYCNPCEAIRDGRRIEVLPLEGLESFALDGVRYEAFNTSGGLGTLCETLDGRVRELNYRTVRYVGHRERMALLINDLRLGQRRELLKEILEQAIPMTYQDVVVIFCTVTGWRDGQFVQVSDARKVYQQVVGGAPRSAIQLTTAAGLCAAIDLHVEGKLPRTGFVKQEDVNFDDFMNNRFGTYFRCHEPASYSRVVDETCGAPAGRTGSRDSRPVSRSA